MKRPRPNGKGGHPAALNGNLIGYARVSTADQDTAAQIDALKAAGAGRVFAEKISGAHADRRALKRMIVELRRGDTVLVTRLDRLARSTKDLLTLLDDFAKQGVGFKSLGDEWANTTTAHGRLMLTVLGGLAEFERSLILSRTSEGRKRAMAAGIKFGRPRKMSAYQQAEALKRLKAGEAPSLIGRSYSVSSKTILRLNGGGA
jgi:DNA invertase Pin-like site-specific DNA recombinase